MSWKLLDGSLFIAAGHGGWSEMRQCRGARARSLALYPGAGKGLRMVSRIARLIAAVALLLTAPACAQPVASAPAPAGGPALWKVADEDTTIYLFGTIHALPEGLEWFEGPLADAFNGSDELVTELDPAEIASASQVALALALLPPDQSLRGLMSAEERPRYEAAVTSLGGDLKQFDRLEPWFATILLVQMQMKKRGVGPESGVESAFVARSAGKTHRGLESAAFQLGLFDSIPLDQQLGYLDDTIDSLPQFNAELDEMVADWLSGNADALALLLNDEMSSSELYERLLVGRNRNWAEWIDQRLDRPGAVFVAVGAGHLAGPGSVQDQLARRGLTVTRVN